MRIETTTQRWVIMVGTALIAAMTLFPPWTYTFQSKTSYSEKPAGYSFIAKPPAPRRVLVTDGVKLDIPRLSVQAIAVGALVILAFLVIAEGSRLRSATSGNVWRRVAALRISAQTRLQCFLKNLKKPPRSGKGSPLRGDPVIDPHAFNGLLGGRREPEHAGEDPSREYFFVDDYPRGERRELGSPAFKPERDPGKKNAALPEREVEKLRKHISNFKRGPTSGGRQNA